MAVRGLLNFNPGNIRYSTANDWLGQTGKDAAGFCKFDTMIHGVRALAKIILRYCRTYKLCSIRGIITRYAPPSENDTEAYIGRLAKALGKPPDAVLDLEHPPSLAEFVAAVCLQETGAHLSHETINEGVRLALLKA